MTTPRPVRSAAALAVLCAGFFLIMLDTTIVVVATPTIRTALSASLNEAVWVTSAYLLAYAVPLLLSGRLGDWVGRRPLFLSGMAVFTAGSLWCGLSGTATELIVARVVAGLGAAAMTPQTMAFMSTLYPPEKRGTPIGIWAGVGAVAAAIGPVLGGVLVDTGGWPWIFMVNVPVGVVGLVVGLRVLPRERPSRRGRPDVLGALLSGIGLFAVVYALQNSAEGGSDRLVGGLTVPEVLVAGLVVLVLFVLWQARVRGDALVPLGLFRRRDFTVSAGVVAAVSFGLSGAALPLVLFLQSGLGLSPAASGLLTMPQALAAAVVGPLAGRLSNRFDPRRIVIAGAALFALGTALLAVAPGPVLVIPGVLLSGVGTGAAFSPLVVLATREVPIALVGSAAGVYNMARQVGMLFGSAAVGLLLQVRAVPGADPAAAARGALVLPCVVIVAGLLLALALRRRQPAAAPAEPASSESAPTLATTAGRSSGSER